MLVFGTDSSQSAGTHTGILQGSEVQLSRCVPKAEVPAGRSRAGSQPRSAAGGQSPACTWDSCRTGVLGARLEKRQGLQPWIFFKLIPEAHTFFVSCTWEVSEPFQEHDPLWMNMLLIRKGSHSVWLHKPGLFRTAGQSQSYTDWHQLNTPRSLCPICLPIHVRESCILYPSTSLFIWLSFYLERDTGPNFPRVWLAVSTKSGKRIVRSDLKTASCCNSLVIFPLEKTV